MIRRVSLTLLLVVSLACAVTAVVARFYPIGFSWVLHDDQLRAVEPAWRVSVGSFGGELVLTFERLVCFVPSFVKQAPGWDLHLGILTLYGSNFQIGYAGGWRHECWRSNTVSVPFWAFSVGFGLYPAYALFCRPLWARRRKRDRDCPICGYDLTGNTSGVCPECGKSTPPTP